MGLSVTERGTMRGTMDGQEQYMVGPSRTRSSPTRSRTCARCTSRGSRRAYPSRSTSRRCAYDCREELGGSKPPSCQPYFSPAIRCLCLSFLIHYTRNFKRCGRLLFHFARCRFPFPPRSCEECADLRFQAAQVRAQLLSERARHFLRGYIFFKIFGTARPWMRCLLF